MKKPVAQLANGKTTAAAATNGVAAAAAQD